MREMIGAVVACLAVTAASACSSATTPPPEGNATVHFINSGVTKSIFGDGGEPTDVKYGGTVLDGVNGTKVSCSVRAGGGSYEVIAHIENADMTLDVISGDINSGASMSFYVQGSTLEPLQSMDQSSNPGPSCVVNTSKQDTKFVINPGSIFASYDCPNVRTPSNLTSVSHTQGIFLFTGCNK